MNQVRMKRAKLRQKARMTSRGVGGGRRGGLEVVIVLMLLLLVLTMINARDYDHGDFTVSQFGELFEPELLERDLDELTSTLGEVHPNLHTELSESEAALAIDRVRRQIDRPMTRLEYFRLVAPLVASFGDGATRAVIPLAERKDYIAQGALLFPLDLDFNGETIRVKHNYSSDTLVAAGTEVVAINGVAVEQLESRLLPYMSGDTDRQRRTLLSQDFRPLQWVVYGFESPYTVVVRRRPPFRGEVERTLLGVTSQTIEEIRSLNEEAEPGIPASLSFEPADSIATLQLGTLRGLDAFRTELDSLFAMMRQAGTSDLILDLRDSEGLSAEHNDLLLGYLSTTPWRQLARIDVKVSKQQRKHEALSLPWYERWYPPLFSDYFQQLYETPVGEIASLAVEPTTPPINPLRLEGSLWVLVNEGSYGAAAQLGAVIKDHRIGTLVGLPGRDPINRFGRPFPFDLPKTLLEFECATARLVRPSGKLGRDALQPDIDIRQNPPPRRRFSPDDPFLARALAEIGASRAEQSARVR